MLIRIFLTATVTLAISSTFAAAQVCNLRIHGEPKDPCSPPPPSADSRIHAHAKWAVANAGLGALTAGLSSHLRGESFWKGALGGATGGTLSYVGKAIVASEFRGSGILGRQVAGIGASAVFNASRGQGMFAQVVLPIGPLRVDIELQERIRLRPRVDVVNLIATAVVAAQPGVTLDWRYTISTGAPVFIDQQPDFWSGRHTAGVITIKQPQSGTSLDRATMEYVIRHERVHLLQSDFTAVAWGRPAEEWAFSKVRGGSTIHRFMDFRSDLLLWVLMNKALDHSSRPTEEEAYFLNPLPSHLNVTH